VFQKVGTKTRIGPKCRDQKCISVINKRVVIYVYTLFVPMKTYCEDSFLYIYIFVFYSIRKNKSKENYYWSTKNSTKNITYF